MAIAPTLVFNLPLLSKCVASYQDHRHIAIIHVHSLTLMFLMNSQQSAQEHSLTGVGEMAFLKVARAQCRQGKAR